MNNVVLSLLFASAILGAILETRHARTNDLESNKIEVQSERKLIDNDSVASPETYLQQLQNTNTHMNEMNLQTRRQDELNLLQNNFDDIERKLDQFRDGLAKKLNELQMGIQRPKIPVVGPGPFMMHPFTSPISHPGSAILNNPASSFQQISSFVPAPSYATSRNPYSSRYSNASQILTQPTVLNPAPNAQNAGKLPAQ